MADIYELPEDVTALSDDELEANITAAVRSFKNLSAVTTLTASTLPNLRKLKDAITTLKDEQTERAAAAEAAAAEIDALAADVLGDGTGEAEAEAAAAAEGDEAEGETEVTASAETEPVVEETVTASTRRTSLNLAAVRARQGIGNVSRYAHEREQTGIELTAAVDVPGYRPGQDIGLADVTEAIVRRAQALTTAGGGVGMVASYSLPFPSEMQINDASSAPEGSLATIKAADQKRLDGGQLTASGGWCAPSETVYSFTERSCPDMLWDLPEVQLNRGGLRFFREPILDVAAMTWVHTEQDDIAGNTKPCFTIPCATPIDVRADAEGICLKYGILTARYFPELIDMYTRQAMVAHEIRLKSLAYDKARAAATAVTTTASFAAFSAVYAAVALQAADMIERLNLCEGTALEVTFPYWTKNLFLADIARQQGVKPQDLNPGIIETAFNNLGVRVQWARGLAPDVPTNIGGATPAVQWPADVEFLMAEAGGFQLGRGPSIDLGVIIDSQTSRTNDAQFFSEEGVALIDRAGTARRVTVTVCPNGAIGPQAAAVCPIA
ncbi:major capsid hexamer protein [Streptomyces phage Mischief19]|nr:major capsid hexamer protein [Streptomyces phage Mischief19]